MMGVQAVGLVRPHASLGKRFLAAVIDGLIGFVLTSLFLVPAVIKMSTAPVPAPEPPIGALIGASGAALILGVFQWWFQGTRGFTIGKACVRIRTVDAISGLPAGMLRVLLRQLILRVGSFLVALSTLFDGQGRNRGWHDHAAGTVVIDSSAASRERTGMRPMAREPVGYPQPAAPSGSPQTSASAPLAHPDEGVPTAPSAAAFPNPVAPAAQERPLAEPVALRAHRPDHTSARPALTLPPYLTSSNAPAHLPAQVAPPQPEQPPAPEPVHPMAPPPAPESAPQLTPEPMHRAARTVASPPPPPTPVKPVVGTTGIIRAAPGYETRTDTSRTGSQLPDDLEMTRLRPPINEEPAEPAIPAPNDYGIEHGHIPPSATLFFSDGREVTLTETVLIGRNPKPASNEVVGELVRVSDPGRSVSKTHVLLGVDSEGVWVIDRASTNGTIVTLADGHQIVCSAHQVVRLPAGAQVDFGDYSIRFEYRNN